LTGTSKFLNDLLFFIGEDLSISISDSFEMSLSLELFKLDSFKISLFCWLTSISSSKFDEFIISLFYFLIC